MKNNCRWNDCLKDTILVLKIPRNVNNLKFIKWFCISSESWTNLEILKGVLKMSKKMPNNILKIFNTLYFFIRNLTTRVCQTSFLAFHHSRSKKFLTSSLENCIMRNSGQNRFKNFVKYVKIGRVCFLENWE